MDNLDIQLLELIQTDGRITISELSKKLSLSRPSITERLRRLEDRGIIEGFSVRISLSAAGRDVMAFLQVSDIRIPYAKFEQMIMNDPDILECHRVTGAISYVLKAAVSDMGGLTRLVDRIIPCGNVNTSVVLSSPLPYRVVIPPISEKEH